MKQLRSCTCLILRSNGTGLGNSSRQVMVISFSNFNGYLSLCRLIFFRSAFEKLIPNIVPPCNLRYLQAIMHSWITRCGGRNTIEGSVTNNTRLFSRHTCIAVTSCAFRYVVSKRRPQHAEQKENPYCSLLQADAGSTLGYP